MALEPATGREIWRYDARVNPKGGYGDFANRGVATWVDTTLKPGAPCRRRIYLVTVDARLTSLDAASGYPCVTFGIEGTIGLREGLRIPPAFPAAYQVTSPPVVVNDLVITGSSIADNSRPAPASGEVRAFDARTGRIAMDLAPDTTGSKGSGVRLVARRQRRTNGRRERLVDNDGRSRARSDLRAHVERRTRLLRRASSRRQPLRELDCRAARLHRPPRLALPDRSSRSLGLRQRLAACARHGHARWQVRSRRRPGDQDRDAVRAAPRDGRSRFSDRGAQSSCKHDPRRGGLSNATVHDGYTSAEPAQLHGGSGIRHHARRPGGMQSR